MFLFFVRHFNDIDHVTPVVWKMNRNGRPTTVFCMNLRYPIDADYRLRFLREEGVPVHYLPVEPRNGRSGRFYALLLGLVQRFSADAERHEAVPWRARAAAKLSGWISGWMRLRYHHVRWARWLLKRTGARCVCFDYVMPGLYSVSPLIQAAREKSIPVIALPHGVYLFTNDATKPKATEERRLAKFNRFDHIVVPNRLRRDLLARAGVAAEKLVVLGSARYCPEWLDQNLAIARRGVEPVRNAPETLRAVFLMSKPQANIDASRFYATLRILAEIQSSGVEVRIKPHTRAAAQPLPAIEPRLTDASHLLTAELCDWADIVMVVGSSVVTEALMRRKPVLYLKYLHTNITRFEELGACWTIQDEGQLRAAVGRLKADRLLTPYPESGVAAFVSETVYGGNPPHDVLETYAVFLEKVSAAAPLLR